MTGEGNEYESVEPASDIGTRTKLKFAICLKTNTKTSGDGGDEVGRGRRGADFESALFGTRMK